MREEIELVLPSTAPVRSMRRLGKPTSPATGDRAGGGGRTGGRRSAGRRRRRATRSHPSGGDDAAPGPEVVGVASDTSKVEDTVRADAAPGGRGRTARPCCRRAPSSSGTVTDVARVGSRQGTGAHRVPLQQRCRHAGERYDITTAPIAHQAEATKREDATKIAIGAGAGAALGAILGGGRRRSEGCGDRRRRRHGRRCSPPEGREVRLGPGADVTTRLTAPLTVRVQV